MATRNSKMTGEEALEKIISGNGSGTKRKLQDKETSESKIAKCLGPLADGLADPNLFLTTALKVLVPLYNRCSDNVHQTSARLLSSSLISSESVLKREAKSWLSAIKRRLCGRRSIHRPFYAEITRDMPYDFFAVIVKVTQSMPGFCQPFYFHDHNRKGEVISFTNMRLVMELLSFLSGYTEPEVATYFKRKLTGMKSGHKVAVLASESKDFAFFYKIRAGKFTISFNFGEWNAAGFPQHG